MNNIALVFPGQGSQYLGMCKDLLLNDKFINYFKKASDLFDIDLYSHCINGSLEDLNSTYIAQPAIFIHSIIIDQILKLNNIKVKAVAGHSLGEYSALVSSGVISFDDCLKILKVRCTEMHKANRKYKGTMLAIIYNDLELIKEICNNFSNTVVANVNSLNQIIISGPIDQIESAVKLLKENNIKKMIRLNVSGAFHSPLMNEANLSLKKAINSVNFNNSSIAVYQNILPKENFEGIKIKENLLKQLTGSVLWYSTICNMKKNNIDTIIEVGPKKVLSNLIRKIDSNINVISIDKYDDILKSGFLINN
jgi:[acyl-carrier-protein] S-malonyltransferase